MTTDRAYAAARQLIDPDADYAVHVRTGTGWQRPGDADQRELPGLDVLLAARRVLRGQPAGRVWSVRPDTLNVRTGDGRVWLRFVVTTLAESDLCDTAGCAAFLTDDGSCTRCSPGAAPDTGRAPAGLWRVLGLAGSAIAPVSRSDLTTADLVSLSRACLTLDDHYFALPRPVLPHATPSVLNRLVTIVDELDERRPHALDQGLSCTELLTLANTALALYRAHGDPNGLLGRPSVLLAHLAYEDIPD